jgi:hypothetical protein
MNVDVKNPAVARNASKKRAVMLFGGAFGKLLKSLMVVPL